MINAWIVARKEKHIDDKFWVCLKKEDALKIAADVVEYWKGQYEVDDESEVDTELYGDMVFHYYTEDSFRVSVQPQQIREAGEVEVEE